MKKNFNKNLIYIIIFIFLSSCSTHKIDTKQREILWNKYKNEFSNKKWNGFIKISYKNFVVRKNFVAITNKDKFRIDLLDSGFLGLIPSPFASLFLSKESVQYKIKGIEKFSGNLKQFSKITNIKIPGWLFNFSNKKWKNIENQIILTKNAKIENIYLNTDKKMRITKIYRNDFEMLLQYNSMHLSSISLKYKENNVLDITIDKISTYKKNVSKL